MIISDLLVWQTPYKEITENSLKMKEIMADPVQIPLDQVSSKEKDIKQELHQEGHYMPVASTCNIKDVAHKLAPV